MAKLEVGATAPAFTLPAADESTVSLSDYAGKRVIVYFYPAAMTPGCTKQACDFRDSLAALQAEGFAVIGISPDKPAKLASSSSVTPSRSPSCPILSTRCLSRTARGARRACTARPSSGSSAPRS